MNSPAFFFVGGGPGDQVTECCIQLRPAYCRGVCNSKYGLSMVYENSIVCEDSLVKSFFLLLLLLFSDTCDSSLPELSGALQQVREHGNQQWNVTCCKKANGRI